jgi:SAM-dependent methyltransferase
VDTKVTVGLYFAHRFLRYLWDWRGYEIRAGDLVLEVGSGRKPMIRSDVLCERYLADDLERTGEALVVDRPLVAANAEALPFQDKTFDVVYSSHLIEHLDAPERFLEECMRVARRGVIECPSEMGEKFIGWAFHKWFVRVEDGVLTLVEKDRPIFDATLSSFCHDGEQRRRDGGPLTRFYWAYEHLFEVSFQWREKIPYQVIRIPPERRVQEGWIAARDGDGPAGGRVTAKQRAYSALSRATRRLHSRSLFVDILPLLACIRCRGRVVRAGTDVLRCERCGAAYPVRRGIPVFTE